MLNPAQVAKNRERRLKDEETERTLASVTPSYSTWKDAEGQVLFMRRDRKVHIRKPNASQEK